MSTTALALVRAAHPEPSLVVTAATVGLGVAVDMAPSRFVVLGVAALAGQLSVGWSNDYVDAKRGLDEGRDDKPLASAQVAVETVRRAAAAALTLAVVASLLLGPVPALLHLSAVGIAWGYNLGLKSTRASVLAYAAAFATMPAVVTTSAGLGAPRPWAVIAAAGFGAGVHFSNVLPDLARDRAAGVTGLPQRLGEAGSTVAAVVLLSVGSAAALLGPFLSEATVPAAAWIGTVVAAALLCAALVAGLRGRLQMAYQATVVVGLLVVVALVVSGGRLV